MPGTRRLMKGVAPTTSQSLALNDTQPRSARHTPAYAHVSVGTYMVWGKPMRGKMS